MRVPFQLKMFQENITKLKGRSTMCSFQGCAMFICSFANALCENSVDSGNETLFKDVPFLRAPKITLNSWMLMQTHVLCKIEQVNNVTD
jgi:hypothetical protein